LFGVAHQPEGVWPLLENPALFEADPLWRDAGPRAEPSI